jgi:hypothetical protein
MRPLEGVDILNPPNPVRDGRGGWRPGAGRPRREDWQADFLELYAATGGKFRSAKEAGVDIKTVDAEIDRTPDFAQAMYEARQLYADDVVVNLRELLAGTRRGNPLPGFAIMKTIRPEEWHDKLVTLNVNANVDVPPTHALEFLQAMLGSSTDATRQIIEGQRIDPPSALPASTPDHIG